MPTKWYTPNQVAKIVKAACRFVEGSIAGKSTTIGKVTHNPQPGGMCARFVRESVEAGLGLAEFKWLEPDPANAREMAAQLRERGYSLGDTSDIRPGDILYRPSGKPGHIALYVGHTAPGHEIMDLIAENTSVKRGFPHRSGTKYTWRGSGEGEFGRFTEVFRLTKPGAS